MSVLSIISRKNGQEAPRDLIKLTNVYKVE